MCIYEPTVATLAVKQTSTKHVLWSEPGQQWHFLQSPKRESQWLSNSSETGRWRNGLLSFTWMVSWALNKTGKQETMTQLHHHAWFDWGFDVFFKNGSNKVATCHHSSVIALQRVMMKFVLTQICSTATLFIAAADTSLRLNMKLYPMQLFQAHPPRCSTNAHKTKHM